MKYYLRTHVRSMENNNNMVYAFAIIEVNITVGIILLLESKEATSELRSGKLLISI